MRSAVDAHRGGDVHRGRERVVRRLAHIDVIVGVNRLFGSEFAAQHFAGAIGDHLVEIHVGLGAGAGLPDHQRKMLVEFPSITSRAAGRWRGRRLRAGPVREVSADAQLYDAERADHVHRHPVTADAGVMSGTFGLRAPIAGGGTWIRPKLRLAAVDLERDAAVDRAVKDIHCRWRPSEPARGRSTRRLLEPRRPRGLFLAGAIRRTTSAPSLGLAGSSLASAARAGAGTGWAEGAGTAESGRRLFGGRVGRLELQAELNRRSKKLLIELNGTTSRSRMPPNDRPTSDHHQLPAVPELVLQNNSHFFRFCASNRGGSSRHRSRQESDEERCSPGTMLGGNRQTRHSTPRSASRASMVSDMVGRHFRSCHV